MPLFALLMALGAHPKISDLETRIDALLETEWARTTRTEAPEMTPWFFTETPLLPAAWPLTGAAVTYAFAWRQESRGSPDHVSALWGKVQVGADGSLQFERLADAIDEVGLQTRAPPCTKECGAEWRELGRQVQAGLFSARSIAAFEGLRARTFYENWITWHGVIADLASKQSPEFFTWLKTKPPKRH